MNCRPVAGLAVAPLIALGLTVLVASPIAPASAGAPVPAPTHVPTDPCDGGPGPQRPCDVAEAFLAATFCGASSSVDASSYADPGDPLVTWNFEFISGHSCPNRSGDIVRTTGLMEGLFNGGYVGPFVCSGMGSCGNASGRYLMYGPPAFVARVDMTTTTVDDPAATRKQSEFHMYP